MKKCPSKSLCQKETILHLNLKSNSYFQVTTLFWRCLAQKTQKSGVLKTKSGKNLAKNGEFSVKFGEKWRILSQIWRKSGDFSVISFWRVAPKVAILRPIIGDLKKYFLEALRRMFHFVDQSNFFPDQKRLQRTRTSVWSEDYLSNPIFESVINGFLD